MPATVIDHILHPNFKFFRCRDEQIRAFRKFSEGLVRASISREHDHPVGRFKTIGIGLVLAGIRAFMEIKMVVFDGRHLDVHILVNHSDADVMTEQHLRYRHRGAHRKTIDIPPVPAI